MLTGTAMIMAVTAGGASTALGAATGCGYSGVMAMIGEGVAWGAASVVGGNAATQAMEGRWMTADENVDAFLMGFGGGFGNRGLMGAAVEARNMFGAPGGSVCFVAGTQVAVAGDSGSITGKAIEDIELGDWVWSRNDETGEEGYKPVVHLFRNTTEDLAHLTYTTGSGTSGLTGTPGHKFWSETQQSWKPMAELQPGETLLLAGGTTATVSSCRVEHLTTPVAIYNFEVADWHTYHVGSASSGWVWVHNKRCTFNGGAYEDLEKSRKIHRHHMLPDSASHVTTQGEGPSIQMLAKDHRKTSSYGNAAYVRRIERMLDQDRWREAFAMEIRDVRRVAREAGDPRRYNSAIREMMAYARKLGLPNLQP